MRPRPDDHDRRRRADLSQISGRRFLRHQPAADLRLPPRRLADDVRGAGRRLRLRPAGPRQRRSISARPSASRASATRTMSAPRSAMSASPSRPAASSKSIRSSNFRLRAELRQGLGGHKGLTGDIGADLIVRDENSYIFSIGPRARWADNDYHDAYFGVTPAVSGATGLAAFDPGSGFYAVGAHGRPHLPARPQLGPAGLCGLRPAGRRRGGLARSSAPSARATNSPAAPACSSSSTIGGGVALIVRAQASSFSTSPSGGAGAGEQLRVLRSARLSASRRRIAGLSDRARRAAALPSSAACADRSSSVSSALQRTSPIAGSTLTRAA